MDVVNWTENLINATLEKIETKSSFISNLQQKNY
jgi:hypothetical protein